jgi:trimeric autotransporter adhesin
MSTKTTFKRIALVAVAALGFGVLSSVSPANAVATSFALDKTSITVVDDRTGSDTLVAVFAITVTNTDTGTGAGLTQNDTITASVVGGPALNASGAAYGLAAWQTDVKFIEIKQSAVTRVDPVYSGAIIDTQTGGAGAYDGKIGALNTGHYGMGAATTSAASTTAQEGKTRTYYIAATATRATVMNLGVYTLQFDLTNAANATIQRTTAKFDVVSAAASSGAVLAAASTGSWYVGETPTLANQVVTDKQITATLTNRDGGAVRTGTGGAPTLSAQVADASTTINYQTLDINDTAAESITAGAATNGVYAVYTATAAWTGAKGPLTLTVRYGLAVATASVALVTRGTATAASSVSVSATGQAVIEPTANNFTVPVTAKTVTYKAKGGTPGFAYVATVTYSNVAAGDQSPVDATPTTVFADANGEIVVTITNANPIDGAKATVNLKGFATTNPADQVINWTKSKAATVSVSLNGAYFALKSENTFTATVTDSFGAPVAGVLLTPVVSGSNADVTGRPTVVTGATGTASITLTDAAAVAAGTDKVTFTEVGTAITGSSTITYAATTPVATTLTPYYSTTVGAAAEAITTPTPSTGIYYTGTTKFDLSNTRDTSKVVTPAAGKELVIKISTGVAGAAVKAEATTKGAYIMSSINLEASSRTRYTSSTGDVLFQVGTHTAGANVITFTSGTASTTVAFWGADAVAADARFVTLTGPKDLVANGDAGSYAVAVTDRYGNPVGGVTLSISATGVATLGGGTTITSFTTDSTGAFTFQGGSSVAAGGAGSFKVSAPTNTNFASLAGKVDTSSVNSTLAAGNNSATLAVTFAAGENLAAAQAQAATDAAAEATDAANAATDAANAAAEAADAATAAAQDAADAVAALSTQVSEMVNALKKQITALTNLVIKIQKKVKA